ncbi:hybrid sensor histidine kinase/response regulator transcription factor [Leeuwenhoekiella sp. MAR_2009_132]|uniref:hybrid sensor histidine kinase/response regulator transcription factor n=1 Tax=Leeuwenhoekiella sp. MAR_2009_132 TaxID=1392489 RepID=UPI00049209D7|nr:hybrid sensor histidine kinase/response regulator transcription factor [Leeuwenhoekiella sp. MAR_2009_132]
MKHTAFYIFLFVLTGISAQNIKFEHYNDTYGLSHNSVRHIVQDDQGFLWLGTFGGLNRFDGYQFKSYLSTTEDSNRLQNDDITALELDADSHNLWIGTRKGLTLFQTDIQKFTTYLSDSSKSGSLPDEEIRAVLIDKNKRVWVGTKNAGLYLFDSENQIFKKIDLPDVSYVKEIFEDSQGNIWIGSFGKVGVAKITLNSVNAIQEITTYNLAIHNSTETNPYLNFIFENTQGELFAGTRKGLFKLDRSTNTFTDLYIEDETIRENLGPYILSIAKAPDGKYWLGTLGGLIVCDQLEDIQSGNFTWYYAILSDDTSLIDNLISALYFDASGVLWIGTEDGLDKYDPYENEFKLNKDISTFIDNQAPRIRGFAQTYTGDLIVATWHNGLFLYANNHIKPLQDFKENIASIYSDDGITFYCGLWNGDLLVYNYKDNTGKVVDIGFTNSALLSVLKYDANTLIAGSFGEGLRILDLETLQPKDDHGNLFSGYEINTIKKLENTLWIATETGVLTYDVSTQNTREYRHSKSENFELPQDNISDIYIDTLHNKIWAATRLGLSAYDKTTDRFKFVEEPKILKNKWITDIALDKRGNMWLNMNNNSIAKYDINTKTANIYNVMSGNRLDIFSSSGFYNFDDATIYLAGKDGVLYFSPYAITENTYAPKPIITEFKVQNKEILPGTTVNGQVPFEEDINHSRSVTLNYANRNFSIQFSTPTYTNERLNKFQYKLEGFDKDWIETTSDSRTVQYTNLYPRTYVFKLRAANSDGVWSETASYQIEILPSFWLSYKGVLLILLFVGILFYILRKQLKIRLALKQELLLEKVKREKDEKLNNDKLRFFTNISHELRTPLTLILGPVKQLLELDNTTDYARSRADLIYQNANRLLRLVNQILDFRRAETGELKLRVSKTEILVSTKNIFNSFIELAHSKNINLNLNIEKEHLMCWIDMDKYNKILYNLLSNAMKFTNTFGNVDLYLGFKDGNKKILVIEVSDDGIGIPVESQEKIFSRFYQAQNSKDNTTGTGIGLSLVKALVEIHKGEIRVSSNPDSGSVFTIELPVNKKAYKREEIFDYKPDPKSIEELVPIKHLENTLTAVKSVPGNTNIKHKILVIDDNTELRNYIVEYLSGYYKVFEAENGKEGLEICRKEKPVLCVADVMMPVMDGFEFVEELKADANISHTAVVMLTALAENENRIKGYKIGVDGYLVKPFDPSLLKTRIDNIIKIHFDLKQKFSGEEEGDVLKLAHSQIDIDLISTIKEIIDTNINNPELTPGFLSDAMAMSSSKLYRKITQLTDLSPNEFIRTIRLKKSVQLLKTKNYNVSEVANLVGFNDPLYFSRCFKKQFGRSPSSLLK